MSTPRFRLVADVRAEIDALDPARVGIGPGGDLWMVAYDRPAADGNQSNATVLSFRDGSLASATAVTLPGRPRFVQPLMNDEVLLVGSRTPGQPNARVVDAAGVALRAFELGDGIRDVQATVSGDIWVGYLDQGTMMGCWPVDPAAKPINYWRLLEAGVGFEHGDGSHNEHYGLVRTSQDGEVLWRFTDSATIDRIFDCDALNVSTYGVWVSYSVFPDVEETGRIVRIDPDGERQMWRTGAAYYDALAVWDESVVLFQRFGETSQFVEGHLGRTGAVEDLHPMPGIDIKPDHDLWVRGCGPVMHCLQGTRWHAMDLRD